MSEEENIVNEIDDECNVVSERPRLKVEPLIYFRLKKDGKWGSHCVTCDVFLKGEKILGNRQ